MRQKMNFWRGIRLALFALSTREQYFIAPQDQKKSLLKLDFMVGKSSCNLLLKTHGKYDYCTISEPFSFHLVHTFVVNILLTCH